MQTYVIAGYLVVSLCGVAFGEEASPRGEACVEEKLKIQGSSI